MPPTPAAGAPLRRPPPPPRPVSPAGQGPVPPAGAPTPPTPPPRTPGPPSRPRPRAALRWVVPACRQVAGRRVVGYLLRAARAPGRVGWREGGADGGAGDRVGGGGGARAAPVDPPLRREDPFPLQSGEQLPTRF